jgi:23S rRNA pseudouridine2605 synthase
MTGSDQTQSGPLGENRGEPGIERGERIAKLLARAGIASRREVERMIAEGRIARDGVPIATPATLLTSLRGVTVDGKPVAKPERTRLFRFHKPAGLLTAERDPAGRPTIYAALRNALPAGTPRMMPVGRLDFSTEGLLLMTNDGEFKRLLELPANGVPRTYRARTFGEISQAQLEELIEGVTVEGVNYGRIDANLERRTGRNQWIELTLSEGKNREVRRVLEHLGLQVSRLIRTAYGPFVIGDLRAGGAEEVRREDLERFRSSIKGVPARAATRAGGADEEGERPRPPAAERRPSSSSSSSSSSERGTAAAGEQTAPSKSRRLPSPPVARGAPSSEAGDRQQHSRPLRSKSPGAKANSRQTPRRPDGPSSTGGASQEASSSGPQDRRSQKGPFKSRDRGGASAGRAREDAPGRSRPARGRSATGADDRARDAGGGGSGERRRSSRDAMQAPGGKRASDEAGSRQHDRRPAKDSSKARTGGGGAGRTGHASSEGRRPPNGPSTPGASRRRPPTPPKGGRPR